jgi:hypothetical protein
MTPGSGPELREPVFCDAVLDFHNAFWVSKESGQLVTSEQIENRAKVPKSELLWWQIPAYLALTLILSWSCYQHPVPNDFDRYVYESIVRSRHDSIDNVYEIVKHETARAEASMIMDSPKHLAELQPMYAIRPLYIALIALLARLGLNMQSAINLISAASLFGIGVLILAFTHRPLYSFLLLVCAQVSVLGRMGTPDAFSSLLVLGALCGLIRGWTTFGIMLLLISLFARTDNLLILLAVLVWCWFDRRLPLWQSAVLGSTGCGIVMAINKWAANYSWTILFRCSFLGAGYPAETQGHLTVREYLQVFATNAPSIASHLALWVLLACFVWGRSQAFGGLLASIAAAAVAHFVLFPSGEDRYFIWAYLIVGTIFIKVWTRAREYAHTLT